MRIAFHGAARGVTGSRHLLEVDGRRVLMDCGLFQGRREESNERNARLGFEATVVDAVLLSHAHIDHSGALPMLVRQGFRGRIYATPATADLAAVMLRDSAFIHMRDVETMNKREGRTGSAALQPLYTTQDADEAIRRFTPVSYGRAFDVTDGVRATFHDAGHILGSAVVRVDTQERGVRRTIAFSGDLGRAALPIVKSPERPTEADVLLIESTYGNRSHKPIAEVEDEFCALVRRVVERRGKVIIPAFAVGRAQNITYMLNNLTHAGRLPEVPVFVDSPLAADATAVFRSHPECWEPEMVERLKRAGDEDPFGFRMLRYLRTKEESMTLNGLDGPAVIIAASGMCEHGRVLHHVANHGPDPRNVILFVGYQADGTLGRRLVDGARQVRILGRNVEIKAQVAKFDALSAHADRPELEAYYRGFENRVRTAFVVHGEPKASESFAQWMGESSSAKVHVPGQAEVYEL